MAANLCCSCNGSKARCVRCVCVKKRKPCVNCFPSRVNACQNNLTHRQQLAVSTQASDRTIMAAPSVAATSAATATHLDRSPVSASGRSDPSLNSSLSSPHNGVPVGNHVLPAEDSASAFESLMLQAYREPGGEEPDSSDCWYNRWLSIVHLSGKLYSLPGGAMGRKYVDHLSKEVSYFSSGTCSSERLLVFSSVILQRHCTIRKGADIRRVIERRLNMWDGERYDNWYRRLSGVTNHLGTITFNFCLY